MTLIRVVDGIALSINELVSCNSAGPIAIDPWNNSIPPTLHRMEPTRTCMAAYLTMQQIPVRPLSVELAPQPIGSTSAIWSCIRHRQLLFGADCGNHPSVTGEDGCIISRSWSSRFRPSRHANIATDQPISDTAFDMLLNDGGSRSGSIQPGENCKSVPSSVLQSSQALAN